jgi:hypothetical protein
MIKYLGYLSFPIQMATKYPVLARLMAGRWAARAVRFVPVFGEHGALLEHAALDLCFNEPVSIRRRIADGAESVARLTLKMALAAGWLGFTVAAAILAWRTGGAAESALLAWADLAPLFAVTGLAAACVLAWSALAPPFARVRRVGWLLSLVALAPGAAVLIARRAMLFQ